MKTKTLLYLLLATSPFIINATNSNEILAQYRSESLQQGRSFLASTIEDKQTICRALNTTNTGAFDQQGYETCINPFIAFVQETLTCTSSLQRQQQATDYDEELLQGMIKDNGEAEIPYEIKRTFRRLFQAAMLNYTFPLRSPNWTLRAYKSKVLNAHAGAGGQIVLSSALWEGPVVFTTDEIAAVIAHEISHVVQIHSLKLDCLALEWMPNDMPLKDAALVFRDDFTATSERGQAWSKASQSYEFAADKMATQILRLAKMDPMLMAAALIKLKPKEEGGFSSGSHPDFDARIKAVSGK
jgi:predicted Zn-dependent protease